MRRAVRCDRSNSGTARAAALNEVKVSARPGSFPLGCARGFGRLRSALARGALAELALKSVPTNGLRTAKEPRHAAATRK